MAKATKKRDKKYVPRKVYYPGVIIQMHSFDAFEKALDDFLINQEVETDHEGTFIYKNAGVVQSFASTLFVYTRLAHIHGIRTGNNYNLHPLAILQNRMYERRGFDEEEIEAARKCLTICRQIISKIPQSERIDICQGLKTTLAVEKHIEAKITDPEAMIGKMASIMGDIGEDLVFERNKEYQALVEEFPDDVRIRLLRDEYSKFLTAYRFKKRLDLSNKGL